MRKIDQEIIDSIREGRNQKALDYLYKDPLKKVRHYILSNSGNIDDANDIFQDAIVVLFHYIKTNKYNEAYEIDAFIFKVAKNAWIDLARKNKKINTTIEINDLVLENSDNQLTQLLKSEKLDVFNKLFQQLEANCQELLKLTLFDKKSMREIKEIMGFKHETVAKSQHYRCKQYFSKLLFADKNALSILRP